MTTSTCPQSKSQERDLVQLARILENITLDSTHGKLSARFYDIGDAGCSLLFRFLDGEINPAAVEQHADHGVALGSPKQNWTKVRAWHESSTSTALPQTMPPLQQTTTIDLRNVNMGDSGFNSLISWLSGRSGGCAGTMLKLLDLRRNLITGTSGMANDFIRSFSSVPVSHSLQTLVLSNNPLSSAFRRTLIGLLHNIPSLRELGLSMTGMTSKDGKALAKYFANISPRCRLIKFEANANLLGVRGIRHIVNSLRYCYSLEVVELYANSDEGLPSDASSSDDDDEGDGPSNSAIADAASYRMLEQVRSRYLMRNHFLKTNIKDEALELLKATRVLMSKPFVQNCGSSNPLPSTHTITTSELPMCQSISAVDAYFQGLTFDSTTFSTLPNELKLAILAELAPSLSHCQFMRVVHYGSLRQTLPQVRLSLPLRQLSPRATPTKPTSPHKFGSLIRTTTTSPSSHSNSTTSIPPTAKEKQVQEWLKLVGCDMFEPSQNDIDSQGLSQYGTQK